MVSARPAAAAAAPPAGVAEVGGNGEAGAAAGAVDPTASAALRIAHLEGQVAALQAALTRRSDELRLLQRFLCRRDLARLARLAAGLPPLPRIATDPEQWQETHQLTTAEVPETLEDLWTSLYPPGSPTVR
jgi:hypothetical protein